MNFFKTKASFIQLVKYCIIGGINTVICALVIYLLMRWGYSLYISNLSGYCVGIISSYILNSMFTFSRQLDILAATKFLLGVFIAYLANLLTISLAFFFISSQPYVVQAMGMVVYTIAGFVINKFWVMKRTKIGNC